MAIKAVQLVTAEVDLKTMAEILMRDLKNSSEGRRVSYEHPVAPRGTAYEFSLRDWGTWESDPGNTDEDDDWEHLTDRSRAVLQTRIDQSLHGLPFKAHFTIDEKNWISFIVFKK
jgi:hypothetical protein